MKEKKNKQEPIHKRKMFMIFEQDFAQPHSTHANQEFIDEHFPAHTPTLWRYEGEHELFFGPKWDDFWSIERLWGIMSTCLQKPSTNSYQQCDAPTARGSAKY